HTHTHTHTHTQSSPLTHCPARTCRHFFSNVDQRKVMSHMTGFLSCALGGKMALSPKQVWLIHRDMLWSPDRTQQQVSLAAAPQSDCCPLAMQGQASSSSATPSTACPMMTAGPPSANSVNTNTHEGCPLASQGQPSSSTAMPSTACPMMTTDRPSAHSDSSFEHNHGCPVALQGQASSSSATPSTVCPMMTTNRSSADSDSTIVHGGCPLADPHHQLRENGMPVLRPEHIYVMTEMLTEALVELNAREELIHETTNLLHSMCWIFERGDVFHDPKKKEEQWQQNQQGLKQMSSFGCGGNQALVDSDALAKLDPWQLVAATVEDC
ncbi:hypothetical protein DUNSADRAFT_11481, partial [Dunaliella salina]